MTDSSTKAQKGTVLQQSPPSGQTLDKGSTVTIVVSTYTDADAHADPDADAHPDADADAAAQRPSRPSGVGWLGRRRGAA